MAARRRSAGPDRFEFLQNLVTEFQDTDSEEAKEQVLANLANFAYDPGNLEALRTLQVLEMFLDALTEDNENFVEFGIGGLCNMSMEPESRDLILQSDGALSLVTGCLSSRRDETVLSAITTLMNLSTPASRQDTTHPAVVQCMLRLSLSQNPRLRNLASVFLQDFCTQEQVAGAQGDRAGPSQSALGIPLPETAYKEGNAAQEH
ncbi:armadillo repeat-containing protein 7-like [Denticeps clupeoides]|uniref:Armadillo repeat-containing protein 7 n=1 Tax=Denticeps clupeoides TaxID=299321 RepID=A0AAY4CS78_9TELE|nr:armadillo repeat-containing protein 7-like [Denticeps clupeoides]